MEADTKTVLEVWDLLTHCAEPAESVSMVRELEEAAQKQFGDGNKATSENSKNVETEGVDRPMKEERDSGKYRIFLSPKGEPYPHESWAAKMILLVHRNEDDVPDAFRVYKNVNDAQEKLPTEFKKSFNDPEVFNEGKQPALLCMFGRQYRCGPDAFDDKGKLKGVYKTSEVEFNYAEHNQIGNSLQLKFPDGVRSGKQALKVTEKYKPGWGDLFSKGQWNPIPALMLSYGQINGLGGDFYAGYNPICRGKDLAEQCKFFMEAFDLLAKPDSVAEVHKILENRQEEVDMLEEASKKGLSTHAEYARLVKPGKWSKFASKEDEDLQGMTMSRTGPSYLRAAQINLDHFGEDAHTAWQAGHFCALQEAAKPDGDLQRAYAMNAFADHYLADCFASGHTRTPRRILHGTDGALGLAFESLTGLVKGLWNDATWKGITSQIVPDLLAKFMHDEDNYLGLWLTRKKDGKKWQAFGDKKLLEKGDEENVQCVIECLQADADEVFEVYRTKKLITDPSKFSAWDYMPIEVPNENHEPLFTPEGKFRNFKPKIVDSWPEAYCEIQQPSQKYDVWQALKANETFKKY